MEKTNFFKLDNYINQLKKHCDFNEKFSNIVCINGPRNCGKTTDTLKYATIHSLKKDSKLMIMRNSDTQLKNFINDLKIRWRGQYIIKANMIFEALKEIGTDTDGEEIVKYVCGEHVGYCCAISTYLNYKSLEFKDISMIIYEEYNEELNGNGLYTKFINLITTAVRFSTVLIVMLGNRDEANNEYMTSWGIEPQENTKEDSVFKFLNGDCGGYFIELGSSTFSNLNNDKTLSTLLANFNPTTKRYAEGGYINDFHKLVKNFGKWIEPTLKPIFYIAIHGHAYLYGGFIFEGNTCFCFLNSELVKEKNYKGLVTYSLDNLSDLDNESKALDEKDRIEICERLFKQYKSLSLFFSSFDDHKALILSLKNIYICR